MNSRFNMRIIVKWLTAVMFISFGVAGVLFFTGHSGLPISFGPNGIQFDSSMVTNNSPVDDKTINNSDGIKGIIINNVSAKVNVIPVNSNEIKAHLYGSAAVIPKLTAQDLGGKLQIRIEYPAQIGVHLNFSDLILDIEVPEGYSGNMDISTVSGQLNIDDLNLENMTVKSVSGKVSAKNVTSKNTTLTTTSGAVELINLKSSLNFKSISGKLNAKIADPSSKVEINTTSGAVDIEGLGSDFTFNSVSGSLDADFADVKGNMKLHSTSGALHLNIPENSDVSLNFQTTSGGFKSSLPLNISQKDKHSIKAALGNGKYKIDADTASGGLELIKK